MFSIIIIIIMRRKHGHCQLYCCSCCGVRPLVVTLEVRPPRVVRRGRGMTTTRVIFSHLLCVQHLLPG